MKCNYCNKEIPNDSKFCAYCAKEVVPSNNTPEVAVNPINNDNLEWYRIYTEQINNGENRRNAIGGLVMGIFALIISFFGSFFIVVALILGIGAIFIGKKYYKKVQRQSLWALIFAGVAIFLSIINGFGLYKDYEFTNSMNEVYSEELNLPIPNKYPLVHNVNSELYPSLYLEYFLEFHYNLTEEETLAFSTFMETDNRWNIMPLDIQFTSELYYSTIGLEGEGVYWCYNRKTNTFSLPTDLSNYDFVIVIFNEVENTLSVYDYKG